MISDALLDLLSRNLGTARQRQINLWEYVCRGQNWNIDFSEGIISFGTDQYPIQLLGTESDSSGTWLWGFANPKSFPHHIIKDAEDAYELCKLANELVDTELEITDFVNGHNISSIATASSKERKCFYRCPYSGGAAFVTISNVPEAVFEPIAAIEVIKLITYLIAEIPINHKKLVMDLFKTNCEAITESENILIGSFSNTNLLVSFNSVTGNIDSMDTSIINK